jgi:hypothetical protein
MKFIEQIFGMSPDGGTGSLEVLLILVPLIAALALLQFWSNRSKR